jgi:hypothetical protein
MLPLAPVVEATSTFGSSFAQIIQITDMSIREEEFPANPESLIIKTARAGLSKKCGRCSAGGRHGLDLAHRTDSQSTAKAPDTFAVRDPRPFSALVGLM